MKEPNISDWRRQTFGDFTSAFRFGEAPAPAPRLPNTDSPLNRAHYEAANLPPIAFPGLDQRLPTQEPGERKRV